MKRKTLIILLPVFLLSIFRIVALPIKTTVRPVSSCPGEYVVGIQVENCYWIGAISLKMNYDAQNLTYNGYQNFNPVLSNGMRFINAVNGQVIISWASLEADSIGNDTLVELRFSSGTGTWPFTWATSVPGDCEYTDSLGNILPSTYVNGNATIYQAPAITQHPANKTAYIGNNVSFYCGAAGYGVAYQWQISLDSGQSWSDLTNAAPYSGVTNSTLYVNSLTTGLSGNLYRCRVSGTCPVPLVSNAARLLVYEVINAFVTPVTPCPGSVVVPVTVQNCNAVGAVSLRLAYNTNLLTFTGFQNIHAAFSNGMLYTNTAGGELFFSWANTAGINIGNTTLFELVFNALSGSATVNFNTAVTGNCEFSDIYGDIINSTYTNGTVNTMFPPSITQNPVNRTVTAGQNTSFSVSASGAGLGYQWQFSTDGGSAWGNLASAAPYSGVNTSTLNVSNVPLSLNGYRFRCQVSGTCPSPVVSGSASLTVNPVIIPLTTAAGSVSSSCTGNISVPVTVTNCNNVGAISLALLFDTTKMSFAGYHSVHPALTSGYFYLNRAGNRVILSCASLSPINIGSGPLLTYRFIASPGISASLTWDSQTSGNCEYSDINGQVLYSTYTGATVSVQSNALTVKAGNDVSIGIGQPVQLNGTVTGGIAPVSYSWTPPDGLTSASVLNPIASPSGTVIYTLSAQGGSCAASDDIVVSVSSTIPVHQNVGPSVVPAGSELCFNALQTLTAGGSGNSFLVQNGAKADLIAGMKISLLPGVVVFSGGTLNAWISLSGHYCNTLTKSVTIPDPAETDLRTDEKGTSCLIFPNPGGGEFTVRVTDTDKLLPLSVKVYNLLGESVADEPWRGSNAQKVMILGDRKGIYLVEVRFHDHHELIKFIRK